MVNSAGIMTRGRELAGQDEGRMKKEEESTPATGGKDLA